jgi:hypothetical protein
MPQHDNYSLIRKLVKIDDFYPAANPFLGMKLPLALITLGLGQPFRGWLHSRVQYDRRIAPGTGLRAFGTRN